MEINKLIEISHNNAKKQGFWDKDRNTGEMLMLVVSELSEALEADRKGRYGYKSKDTFEDEIADTFIRLADLCGGLSIDIVKQIKWKIEYNKKRIKKHGKKY